MRQTRRLSGLWMFPAEARFVACGNFLRAERIGEPRRSRARLQRLLLALMGCPAAKVDNLERRAHPAIRFSKKLRINGRRAGERVAAERFFRARGERIGG